mmetsp:Transcript_18590/g.34446  ORF Transcript_18590/g.34446 Transcript_18590/m.34446 type:complete len:287 (+) Transcript_18590:308-1168(+)
MQRSRPPKGPILLLSRQRTFKVRFTCKARAIDRAPSGPIPLLNKPSSTIEKFLLRASPMQRPPDGPRALPASSTSSSVSFSRSASAITRPPSAPSALLCISSSRMLSLALRISEIASAPIGPSSFSPKSSSVTEVFEKSASASAQPSSGPKLFFERLNFVWPSTRSTNPASSCTAIWFRTLSVSILQATVAPKSDALSPQNQQAVSRQAHPLSLHDARLAQKPEDVCTAINYSISQSANQSKSAHCTGRLVLLRFAPAMTANLGSRSFGASWHARTQAHSWGFVQH